MSLSPAEESILRQRAQRLARPLPALAPQTPALSLLRFTLGSESYALESKYVLEVVSTKQLLPLPGVPSFVKGILSVQGQIWSIIDIRDFFAIAKDGPNHHSRAILVSTPYLRWGLLADAHLEILYPKNLDPPPGVNEHIPRNFIKGTLEQTVVVLDIVNFSADPRLLVRET